MPTTTARRHLKAVPPARDTEAPPARPKPSSTVKRAAKHATVGISPLPPHPITGQARHRLRWVDAEGADREKQITGAYELAEKWAVQQHARNVVARSGAIVDTTKAELAGIDPKAKRAVQRGIREAATAYVTWLAEKPDRAGTTLRHAHTYLVEFSGWCEARGIVYFDQLTIEHLEDYRASLASMRQPNGKPYKGTSLNSQMSPIHRMINREHKRRRAPHLSPVFVGEALELFDDDSESARALTVDEIRAELRAAMRYDWRPRQPHLEAAYPRRCLAIDIAMLLVDGFRLAEYTLTPCSQAALDDVEHAVIKVVEKQKRKGKKKKIKSKLRTVYMRGFTVIGTELMRELKRGHGEHEWLSEHGYGQLQTALPMLMKYGGPIWTDDDGKDYAPSAHDFRATCATYQCALKDIDSSRSVDRLGHTEVIAEEVYRQPPKGMKFGAESLEDAMCAVELFREVLEHYRKWRATYGTPRTAARKRKAPGYSQALLAKDPHAVRDALNVHPAKRHARSRLPVPTDVTA